MVGYLSIYNLSPSHFYAYILIRRLRGNYYGLDPARQNIRDVEEPWGQGCCILHVFVIKIRFSEF